MVSDRQDLAVTGDYLAAIWRGGLSGHPGDFWVSSHPGGRYDHSACYSKKRNKVSAHKRKHQNINLFWYDRIFILYLDHPTYAMAVVLFSLLLFSGFGSRWGSKILSISAALLILLVFLTGWLFLLPALLRATLGLPLAARISISIISVAPIGFLMGIPFPAGLEWMREYIPFDEKNRTEGMVAWLFNPLLPAVA
jgi:hypothetical protein